jgi:tartrate dehydratase alpha subunit/fumarate hydratase class I-like protein
MQHAFTAGGAAGAPALGGAFNQTGVGFGELDCACTLRIAIYVPCSDHRKLQARLRLPVS